MYGGYRANATIRNTSGIQNVQQYATKRPNPLFSAWPVHCQPGLNRCLGIALARAEGTTSGVPIPFTALFGNVEVARYTPKSVSLLEVGPGAFPFFAGVCVGGYTLPRQVCLPGGIGAGVSLVAVLGI